MGGAYFLVSLSEAAMFGAQVIATAIPVAVLTGCVTVGGAAIFKYGRQTMTSVQFRRFVESYRNDIGGNRERKMPVEGTIIYREGTENAYPVNIPDFSEDQIDIRTGDRILHYKWTGGSGKNTHITKYKVDQDGNWEKIHSYMKLSLKRDDFDFSMPKSWTVIKGEYQYIRDYDL